MRLHCACLVQLLLVLFLLFTYGCNCEATEEEKSSSTSSSKEDVVNRVVEKVLSRKRRYLTFPEGSSLQVVYDQTIPIVALPLFYTIGVTVALAYELPSKPWYHYVKDIRQNIQSGAYLGLSRKDQNVSELTYTADQGQKADTFGLGTYPASFQPTPAKANLLNVAPSYSLDSSAYTKHPYYYKDVAGSAGDKPWNRVSVSGPQPIYYVDPGNKAPGATTKLQPVSSKLNYYFGKSPTSNPWASMGSQLSQWMKLLPQPNNKNGPKKPIYWSDVVKGLSQMATRRKDVGPVAAGGPQQQQPAGAAPFLRPIRRNGHRKPVLPVFGKRSVDNQLREELEEEDSEEVEEDSDELDEEQLERFVHQEEQKHFTRHHRHTRHDLYSKIEVYLNSKGLNGRACVLKTLCETSHKHQDRGLPNTFAAELIKTIFRLPPRTEGEELASDKHSAYDLAHHAPASDCAALYKDCPGDLWSHPFLF